MAGPLTRLVGKSWPSGLISPRTTPLSSFPSEADAFKKVVAPAQAILGKDSIVDVVYIADVYEGTV